MKKKIVWLVVSCVMALSLVLASCAGEEEEEEEVTVPAEEEEVVIPTEEEEEVVPPGGNWWDKFGEPEYGGTMTILTADQYWSWDPYRGLDFTFTEQLYYENLTCGDWTLDREIFSYEGIWTPNDRYVGWVAESWDLPDYNTIIFHIRPGIHWQDKFPANGRELTAADVAYSFNRQWGCGDGFTEISPYIKQLAWECFQKIYATDKYTMVVEHTDQNTALEQILQPFHTQIVCRDAVEAFGDLTDWEDALGTGPFILDDYVTGASMTLSRNPNYWGWDERHPQNKIPYIDVIKKLIIPDVSTQTAALRTGKIDSLGGFGITWEMVDPLLKTNPELIVNVTPGSGVGPQPRLDTEPFNDIRVRKAMDLAIDRKTIAETLLGGYVEPNVQPQLGRLLGDYFMPFSEWPKELQDEYRYDPAAAKALLAEAGYPNGFKTNCWVSGGTNDMMLVFQAYFADIGIDMEIKIIEAPAYYNMVIVQGKHDQMSWEGYSAWGMDPYPGLNLYMTGYFRNQGFVSDPWYDEKLKYARVAPDGTPRTEEEQVANAKELDMYIQKMHWRCVPPESVGISFRQPWIKGLSNESIPLRWPGMYYARCWIDQDLKKSLGY